MFKLKFSKVGLVSFVMASLFVAFATFEALGQPPPAPGGRAGRPTSGGALRIAIANDQTRFLDARYIGSPERYPATMAIYNFLLDFGAKYPGEIVPGLFESWKQVDPLTYLFSLKKGVKFHNGREMTAEDVKANLDWMLKTPTGWTPVRRRAFLARVVERVETVDRHNLRIRLKAPFALLIPTLRMVKQGMAPPEEVTKWGKDFTLHPMGTGPFKFVELVPGDRVVLERFDGYWGPRPHLDRLIYRTIPDEQSRIIALQAGEVDITRVELSGLAVVRKDPNLKVIEVPTLAGTMGIWFNMRRWPMSSLKFRTAVVMGADWHKFPQATYAGIPIRTPLERSWAENPRAKELLPAYDPDKARQLIKEVEAEAGRAIPPLTFLTPATYSWAQIGELAKSQLKKIGVTLNVQATEAIVAARQALKWDIVLATSRGSVIDPYFLFTFFSAAGEGDIPDGKNMMGYLHPRIDELLKQAATTEDRGERKKIYQEIEEIVLKDLPGFHLFTNIGVWPMKKEIQHTFFGPDGELYITTSLNNTWIQR